MADDLWPILILIGLLVVTGTLGIVVDAVGEFVHLLCPDPSNPFNPPFWC